MFGFQSGTSKSGESWNNFTTCFIKLVEPNVTDYFSYAKAARTTEFDKHKNIHRLLEQPGAQAVIFRKCLNKLVSHCRQAKLRVTKVLRLSLRFLPLLMNQIPDLKVLFVIRDPRGIINSRIKTAWYGLEENDPESVRDNIKSLCFKIQEDLKMIDDLKRNFPGRFLDLSLEDIVKQSMKSFQAILSFGNLEMTDTYLKKDQRSSNCKASFFDSMECNTESKIYKLDPILLSSGFEKIWLCVTLYESQHDKTNKMTCVPSEDSD